MKTKIKIGDWGFYPPTQATAKHLAIAHKWGWRDKATWPFIIAEICDFPVKNLKGVSADDLLAVFNITVYPLTQLDFSTTEGMKDLDRLTWGEWIDLDTLTQKGVWENLLAIGEILWGTPIDDYPAGQVQSGVEKWLKWRRDLYRSYSGLFEVDDSDGPAEKNESDSEPADPSHYWFETTALLAESFINLSKVTERPVRECLNWLAYIKTKVQREQQAQRNALNKVKR